jgi:tRNA-dihydrouridine synthase B
MIGRAAQGRPWIFREVAHFLATGELLAPPPVLQARDWLLEHLDDHYGLYGEHTGVRTARKHIGWAVRHLPGGELFRAEMNRLDSSAAQVQALARWCERLADHHPTWPAAVVPAAAANDASMVGCTQKTA